MALSAAFLDELRARTSLSALVGQSVKLSRAGREHKGCCPFHQEKTPSFTVNDDKGFYHCFGCGAHGDALRWLTDQAGLGFMDAVRQLADAAGMEVPARSPEAAARAERIDGIRPALEAAQALYVRELEQPGAAREYLHGRGIDAATIEAFGLGWAPARRGHLRDIGIQLSDALAAGLAWEGDGKAGESFFLRVMVPVHDARGRLIGFGGRSLQPSSLVAKYKNSPDSEIFDKGRVLFNLHRAAPAARQARRLVIVEGYFDVIGLAAVGITEAVAPMGTACTVAQLELGWRAAQIPCLAFDGDAAGRAAARRACETALPLIGAGRSLSVALFPDGQDPDDVARAGGREAVEAVLGDAVPMARFLFDSVVGEILPAAPGGRSRRQADVAGHDDVSPDIIAGVWHQLEALAGTIVDAETRAQYLALWRGRYDAEVSLSARLRPPAEQVAALIEADEGKYAFPDEGEESVRKLKMIAGRVLDLRAQRRELNDDIKSVMQIAKAFGFSTREITKTVIDMEADPAMREQAEAIHISYRRALGVQGPLTEAALPVITGAAVERAAQVVDKRLSRTLALIDAREVGR